MNDFWNELRRLVKCAEKASSGNSAEDYNAAYFALRKHMNNHAPPDSADAEIAELRRDAERYRFLANLMRGEPELMGDAYGFRWVLPDGILSERMTLRDAIDAARGGE